MNDMIEAMGSVQAKCETVKPPHKNLKDLTGKVFGRLTVIRQAPNIGRRVQWICRCSCGNEKQATGTKLVCGDVRSCGCIKREGGFSSPRFKDLTGKRIGRLTVLHLGETIFLPSGKRRLTWVCRCDCGNTKSIRSADLTKVTRSCGCWQAEWRATGPTHSHGMTNTRIYTIWTGMVARCTRPNSASYGSYGARGIKVCPEWHAFENFFRDMGHPPYPGASIERTDNNGDYTPENCIWADSKTQNRNKRSNRLLTVDGVTRCEAEWAELQGMSHKLIHLRRMRGWSDREAVLTPAGRKRGSI